MTKFFRIILFMTLCFVVGSNLVLPAFAESENPNAILCVSYRGDTAEFESNSTEAVVSAFSKGADFVSVNIRKTADGELVLCRENETEVKGVTLKDMMGQLAEDDVLILDSEPQLKDEIYELLESENAFSSAVIRINDSTGNILKWIDGKNENLQVIGVYDSFVVFTAMSHIRNLGENGMQIVQYQSKNYFNEMFGSLVSKTIKAQDKAKALVPTYSPYLCGQRSDSEDGWNDLIKKGYSVIETNNLDAFLGYIKANESIRLELSDLTEKAYAIDVDKYNTVSKENLEDAIAVAQGLLNGGAASSDELQSSASKLILAMDNLALKSADDTQKGALNITAGKVIAAVLVGAVILAAQIYTYKMQKGKKK